MHLAFFSGNECYWKIRWENSIAGPSTPNRTMVCCKETRGRDGKWLAGGGIYNFDRDFGRRDLCRLLPPAAIYSADVNYFSSARTSDHLTAPASATTGGNGIYAYGPAGSFPTNTFNFANYWVDVIFDPA
jgi:hypothetical protein